MDAQRRVVEPCEIRALEENAERDLRLVPSRGMRAARATENRVGVAARGLVERVEEEVRADAGFHAAF
jgi:hypothetical protein